MTTYKMATIHEFIKSVGVTMTAEHVDANPNMEGSDRMDNWRCVLRAGRSRRMTVPFSMGFGHNGNAPEAADVLHSLAQDSAAIENGRSFENWCDEYGYDTDSRRAEKTYKLCQRQAEKLRKLLGDFDYQTLLFDTESL